MAYTDAQLAIVCPRCHAAAGGKCLVKKLWGSAWIESPHAERVAAAEEANVFAASK